MEQKCLCLAVDQADFAREYSGRQHAHHPADTVTGEDIQRIVQIGFRLPMNRNVADYARGNADENACSDTNKTGRGGDGDQTDDRANTSAESRGLSSF